MPAALAFAFDPVIRLSETASVRLETIGLAVVLFAGLLLAARIASVTPAIASVSPAQVLRVDDLVFMVVGAVPGAIVGGRLGYVLDHLAYYQAHPGAILDPAQGGLSLTLAVPLGLLTGGVIARLLGAPVSRWMHAIALPLLFVLGAGKLTGVLGGTGQGVPADLSWATAYVGPGPWGSLAADVQSHPSQAYEAIAVGVVLAVVAILGRTRTFARRDGAILYVALLLWAGARFVVAFTWRDPVVAGPLRTEQLLLIVVVILALLGLLERARAGGRVAVDPPEPVEVESSRT
ncbi:MAG TPA: prolipoprotein diacylglyceryl transferase family protein [Candidatus Limnocylindria bacterium]|nr:prolipoprotein diacylglyceryl transferase family protein [Candidatus Limnocylindria bacterium]